ncbi:MAG: hypothetical protein ABIL25_08625 [candidate division WOR-3 bacterium]
MPDRRSVATWISKIVEAVPCRSNEELDRFIGSRPVAKITAPAPELVVGDHWFSLRRYHDVVSNEDLLEVYIGSKETGAEYMGYDRIDPHWKDAEGRDRHRWELTRAYMRPRYRGRKYSGFMLELVLALARKNRAFSVVAYPRHVAMLVTLLKYGFHTMDGSYDHTLRRILRQGLAWYGRNTAQRQLYYAQEFRPFIQEGSFVMEKRVAPRTVWEFLLEKI